MKRLLSLALVLLLASPCLVQGQAYVLSKNKPVYIENGSLTVGGNIVAGSGALTGNLLPNTDGAGTIGSTVKGWAQFNLSDTANRVYVDPIILQPTNAMFNIGDATHGVASLHVNDGTGTGLLNLDAAHNVSLVTTSAHGLVLGSNNMVKWTIPSAAAATNDLVYDIAATSAAVGLIRSSEADGADNGYLALTGGGAVGAGRAASLALYGNDHASTGGAALTTGRSGALVIATGRTAADAAANRVTIPADDDVDNATIQLGSNATTAPVFLISALTSDADDDASLTITAGGAAGTTRGAGITLLGDDVGGAGAGAGITYEAGTGTAGTHKFFTEGTVKMTIFADGTVDFTATDLGWRAAAAANQICTTTCGANKGCLFGLDAGTHALVSCSDNTADTCICSTT